MHIFTFSDNCCRTSGIDLLMQRTAHRFCLEAGGYHAEIAFVGAPPVYHSRKEMLAGYRSAIESNHLPLHEELIWLGTEESDTIHLYELENGEACARALTQLPNPPTAYLCINDQSAIGLIRGLQMLGVHVPEDVSVMGFDNIPQGELTHPSLTTIDQQAYEMGRLGAEELFRQIQDPITPIKSTILMPTIIERDSVCRRHIDCQL